MTLTLDETARRLGETPLFAGVDPVGLEMIARRVNELDVPADRPIVRQGEIGTGFYIIVSGTVEVIRDGVAVARLGPGEFFGELSVLDRMPRNASVAADGPTSCLALASWDFDAVLLEQPALTLAILRGVAARLREVTESVRH